MSPLPVQNPKIPEGINHHNDRPLTEFFQLLLAAGLLLGALLLAIMLFTRWLVPYVPFSWEERLTQPLSQSQFTPAPRNGCVSSEEQESAEEALQQLLEALAIQAGLLGQMSVTAHFIDMPEANAFATLGGHIFVTTGLLQQVGSENALSMVLAHELAHVQLRHPLQSLSRGVLVQLALGLLGVNENSVNLLVTPGSMLTLLSFSREMEREADTLAIAVLEQRYGGLQGADEFFVAMHDGHADPAWQSAVQTHPAIGERLHYLTRIEDRGKALQPLPETLVIFKHQLRCNDEQAEPETIADENADI